MSPGEAKYRRAVNVTLNRHWLARVVIGAWALHIPFVAFLTPDSLAARGMAAGGFIAYLLMAALAVMALLALADSAVNDLMPERFMTVLMFHRHLGYMGMSIVLVIVGGAISVETGSRAILAPYLLPAMFCVAVTWLDLHAKRRMR